MLMKGRWSINYLILLIDGTPKRNERMKWFCANTAEKCQNVEICSIINWLCNYREGAREREERIEAIETNCHGDNFSRFTSCKFMDHLFHFVVLVLLSIYFPPVHFKCFSNWGWGRELGMIDLLCKLLCNLRELSAFLKPIGIAKRCLNWQIEGTS